MVENREFGKQMFEYLSQLNSLRPADEAARTAFGPDLGSSTNSCAITRATTSMASGGIALGERCPP